MYLSETYEKKWQPVLEHPELPKITDSLQACVTALSWKTRKRASKRR